MKKTLLPLFLMVGMAGISSAATLVNYVASGDPNQAGDSNNSTADVWQCAFPSNPQNAGSGFFAPANGTPGAGTNDWVIYSYGDTTGATTPTQGIAYQTYNFQGDGTLDPGQSVSLLYAHNTNINAGKVGIQLLSATGAVQAEFVFIPGGTFQYGDSGVTGFTNEPATGKQYDPNDPFTVTFTLNSSTSYSGTASATATNTSSGAWSGTYTSPIAAIRVVDIQGGNGSDQYSNDLTVTTAPVAPIPEPTSLALLASGGLLGGLLIRRRNR